MNPAGRRQSPIFPREHGAWGILLVPLVTGASVGLLTGRRAWPLAPLSIAVLALFWLRTPVESWIGTAPARARTHGELDLVRNAALALAAASMAASIWLFLGRAESDSTVDWRCCGDRIHRSDYRKTGSSKRPDGGPDGGRGGADAGCARGTLRRYEPPE
jgi:hypothetical protein